MGFRDWPARLFIVEWIRIGGAQPLGEPAGDLVQGRGVCGADWTGSMVTGAPFSENRKTDRS